MDENLQQSFIYNNNGIETGESFDFSTAIQQTTQSQESLMTSHGNMTDMSNTSCNFATFDIATHTMQQRVLNYLKFYYFLPNDVNFYLVICKIILQDSFNDHNHYDHEFFYQHPSYPTIRYHVSCKLLSYSLVENILNNEMCGINFDTELLSTNDVGNNEMITQTVSSMAGNQNYNDSDFSSNEHITHQDTNGLATRIFQ
ncbi:1762_t:CDS:2 [Rhizophagus irregularis]|nr:1762_t:CDS:2 [Rhizophagus irregularis]